MMLVAVKPTRMSGPVRRLLILSKTFVSQVWLVRSRFPALATVAIDCKL